MKSNSSQTKILGFAFLILLLALASFFRFYNLGGMDPFFDETGNILASNYSPSRLVLSPNRQGRPLLTYLFKLVTYSPLEPIITARMTTASVAVLGAAGFAYLLYLVAGAQAAFWGLALWALSPVLVLHDRQALQDPFTTFFLLCSLLILTIHYRRRPQPSSSDFLAHLLASIPIGLAIANKISALILAPGFLAMVYVIQISFGRRFWSLSNITNALFMLLGAGLIFIIVLEDLNSFGTDLWGLRHVPVFMNEGQSGGQVLMSILRERLGDQLRWIVGFHSYAYLGLIVFAIIYSYTRKIWPCLILGSVYLSYYLINSVVYSSRIYLRYVHPDHLLGFFFLALTLSQLRERNIQRSCGLACLGLLSIWGYKDYLIVSDIRTATLPAFEMGSVKGYFGGSGLRELESELLAQDAENLVVFGCDYFCSGFYYLKTQSLLNPRLKIVPLEIKKPSSVAWVRAYMNHLPKNGYRFFLLFEPNTAHNKYQRPGFIDDLPVSLKRIAQIDRVGDDSSFVLEEIGAIPDSGIKEIESIWKRSYSHSWFVQRLSIDVPRQAETPRLLIEGELLAQLSDSPEKFEILLDEQLIFSGVLNDLGSPFSIELPLETNGGQHEIELRSYEWSFPELYKVGAPDKTPVFAQISKIQVK